MGSEKIMVVDDHREYLELLSIHLKSLGWDVIPASNGREALEKVRSIKPNLIVLDMDMPEMDGFEVARSLKEDPNYRDIPILAATALAMPRDRERCLTAGCNDYISKPFTQRDLENHLTRLLSENSSPG
ncbi:MAG: response regulator [Candidatus Binatia bacterium]